LQTANSDRLRILFLSPFLPSPVTFGAQRRIQGLLASLTKRHAVTAVCLAPASADMAAAVRGVEELGAEAVIVRGHDADGTQKRLIQMRSLLSLRSFERRLFTVPKLQRALDDLLIARQFHVVNLEFPFFSHYRLRQAPAGEPLPRLILDEHNVEYDVVRQMTGPKRGLGRHIHNSVNWPKLRREEAAAWRDFDGVMFTSASDVDRARAHAPGLRARLIPNAVDVHSFRPDGAPVDGDTVLFFGTLKYFPNYDGVLFFLREIWPLLAMSHPRARVKVVGADPPQEVLALQGPRVEFTGLVEDVRSHIATAAVSVVPLRIGGGTRLKILEAMAMARPIVTTSLGVEGIRAQPGRDLLVADTPADFAAAVGQILDNPALAGRLGCSARSLVEADYSWDAVGRDLEEFFREVLAEPARS
jgi:glycosyltransferase involved in cell wall biosynthesis